MRLSLILLLCAGVHRPCTEAPHRFTTAPTPSNAPSAIFPDGGSHSRSSSATGSRRTNRRTS